jgi:PIN domain nuclease of toxin-antitoxin system
VSNATVLDASAVLACLHREPGGEAVENALLAGDCLVSAANHAEIIARALDRGVAPEAITAILAQLGYQVADVTAADGQAAGLLRGATRSLGLSLGDRLCLALAQRTGARTLTADRPWLQVAEPLGLRIVCIRPNAS